MSDSPPHRTSTLGRTLGRIGRRLGSTLLVLLGAVALLFVLTLFISGNPAQVLLGPRATPEAVRAFSEAMGLDRPVLERFALFVWNVVRGDLGKDVVSGRPIATMVAEVLPYTATLTAAAIGMAVAIGAPLGCYAATHPNSLFDRVTAMVSIGFIAIPNFVVAILLLMVFSIWLDWFPVLGVSRSGDPLDQLVRLVLPAVSLAAGWVGYIARLLRASLLEVLGEPHIRTLRAYGVPERTIVYKYALKPAAIPTVAILGLGVGRLLGGAIFTEIVFARPGLGTLVYDAIATRNYPVVQACVLVIVGLFTLANLLTDLTYGWLDPRIRTAEAAA